jgi:hypothetical protein
MSSAVTEARIEINLCLLSFSFSYFIPRFVIDTSHVLIKFDVLIEKNKNKQELLEDDRLLY